MSEQTDQIRYVIRLTGFKPPKYVFKNNTFVQNKCYARKFSSRKMAEKYAKSHSSIAEPGYEIIEFK